MFTNSDCLILYITRHTEWSSLEIQQNSSSAGFSTLFYITDRKIYNRNYPGAHSW